MRLARPEFVPDPSLSREEMESLQGEIAEAATFADDAAVDTGEHVDSRSLVVAGVDQGFDGDDAVSVVVLMQDGEVIERVHARAETEIPYIPGLLSFREGGAVLSAFEQLEREPDVVLVDGSGRIHFREAGLATHIGVALDVPAVGVAKSLLCGDPAESTDGGFPEGTRVPIRADEDVTAPAGTTIGYAVQTRQYDAANRHINPLLVSPGHRVSARTAADLVQQQATRYKLPEPIRRADSAAADLTG